MEIARRFDEDPSTTGPADVEIVDWPAIPTLASAPCSDDELWPAEFPPRSQPTPWAVIERYAVVAELSSGIGGLSSFLLAVARALSDGDCSMLGSADDETLPLRMLFMPRNFGRRLANNPWRPAWPEPSDPMAARWNYVGGLFDLIPAVALTTTDRRGYLHDPARVFDPVFAVAYATDLVFRLRRRARAHTWGHIRAWWSRSMEADLELTPAQMRAGIDRLTRELAVVDDFEWSPSLATESVAVEEYTGFTHVLLALRQAERSVR